MSYRKNNNFKQFYCTTTQRNIWLLGEFEVGFANIKELYKAAEDFAEATGVNLKSVHSGQIEDSARFKGFYFIFSIEKKQSKAKESILKKDVFKWLNS